jgi:hypothetical protein
VGDLKSRVRVGERGKRRSVLSALLVSAILGSLLALVAGTGSAAAAECPNEEFRIEKSATLPDCRAYEQVSPVLKEFGASFPLATFQPSVEGGAAMFQTQGPLPGSPSGPFVTLYIGRRAANGWTVSPATPKQTAVPGGQTLPTFFTFSENLSKWTFQSAEPPLVPGVEPGVINLFEADGSADGPFTLLTPPQGSASRGLIEIAGVSADYSRFFVAAIEPLLGEESGRHIYEFHTGAFTKVDILPNGEGASTALPAVAGSKAFHVTSDDGSHFYFEAETPGENFLNLYVRVDGSRTVEVAQSHKSIADVARFTPRFWQASANGNLAFFTSQAELTEDANTGIDGEGNQTNAGSDLYVSNIASGELTDISVDNNPADAATGANVLGVVGASEDGSRVYFVASGAIDGAAQSGQPNLYLWEGGTPRYVATLSGADLHNWTGGTTRETTSYVSPDGLHVLLSSAARLTDYDNTDAVTGEPDTEIYRYSARSNEFDCVSCRPDGARPHGSTTVNPIGNQGLNSFEYPRRSLSDDGSTAVFTSSESLVPADVNGIPDIYEYRDGEVHLLSPGNGAFPSWFLGMSPGGEDVFLGTAERLTRTDTDDLTDVYDARREGGFPPPFEASKACAGAECQRSESAPPGDVSVGSSSLWGAGNVKPNNRCVSGKKRVHRKGKVLCVPRGKKKNAGGKKKNVGGKKKRHAGSGKGDSK